MSRLSIITSNQAQATVESLYKDLERRIIASPPGLCPLDLASSFLKLCAAQTCGKCVPCRVGLPQLERLIEDILDGRGTLDTIGPDYPLEQLRREFDAVYIAIGAHIDKPLDIPGEDAKGVVSAVSILRRIGDDDYPDLKGRDVVVIGGGNVAMDCARSALRLGARSVDMVYRRRKEDMTALAEEVEATEVEGCQIYELATPLHVEVDEAGHAKALWIQQQMISAIKGDRPTPRPASTEPTRLACDLLIVAVGQGIESKEFEKEGVAVRRGSIASLDSEEVSGMPGIFAGGDCVSGPATVIRAIAAGKVAAANIDEYLGFQHVIQVPVDVPTPAPHNRPPCAAPASSSRARIRTRTPSRGCATTRGAGRKPGSTSRAGR